MRVKDHRDASGDFAKLILNRAGVRISPKPAKWLEVRNFSRLHGQDEVCPQRECPPFRGSINVGSFDAIHPKLNEVSREQSRRNAQIKKMIGPIKLPFEARAPRRDPDCSRCVGCPITHREATNSA